MWEILWKAHIRSHLEHAIQTWSPYLIQDIAVIHRAVNRHISGLKGLKYQQRLTNSDNTWIQKNAWRRSYQVLSENVELRLNTWHWVRPVADIEGPARGIRAGCDVRLNPPVKSQTQQRLNFLATRVAVPLRELPKGIMSY